jgi:hypothetical protein
MVDPLGVENIEDLQRNARELQQMLWSWNDKNKLFFPHDDTSLR